jgi:hypothetical protein
MLSPPFAADLPLSDALFKRVPLPLVWPLALICVLFSASCASVFGTDRAIRPYTEPQCCDVMYLELFDQL